MARSPKMGPALPIETIIGGKKVTGYYRVEGGMVPFIHVTAHGGRTESTQLGDSDPEDLARIMLLEVASE